MANKFFGAIDLTGNSDGDLDQINDSVLSDGDGGYVITDAERIYIYHYDSGDTGNEDSPRLIKPDTVGDGNAGSWMIAEIVAQNFVMATNAQYLKAMQSDGSTEAGILRLNSSDDTEIRAITGQSVDVIINSTKVLDVSASGLQILGAGATINEFSTDGTMGGNSDTAVPTEKAIVTYLSTGFVTLTGVETLTNKTLTTPIINQINTASGKAGATFTEDGAAALMFNELTILETAANSITVHSGDGAYDATYGWSGNSLQILANRTAAGASNIHLKSDNAAGASTMGIGITGGGQVDIYYNGTIEASTRSGYLLASNGLSVAGDGATVTGIKDEDNMASNSAVKLATQQSIKAYVDSGTVTMTNKTLTSPVLNTGVSGTAVKDEDDMSSNSATHIATQQSIKAYVDSGTVTMTNKTLTSPVLNTGVSGTAFLDEDNMASDSATKLASQQSIKAYADTKMKAYRETFGSAATWNVNHALGIQNCNVEVIVGGVSVAGTYDEPTITFTDANNLTVVFTVATAGDVVVTA